MKSIPKAAGTRFNQANKPSLKCPIARIMIPRPKRRTFCPGRKAGEEIDSLRRVGETAARINKSAAAYCDRSGFIYPERLKKLKHHDTPADNPEFTDY